MDLKKHPPAAEDLIVPIKLDNLQIGCDCGCLARVMFHRVWDDSAHWTMYVEGPAEFVRVGPFRRLVHPDVELVLDKIGTVDALIAALQKVRESFGAAPKG